MRSTSLTIRTDPRLKKAFAKFVRQLEMSLSDYLNLLMRESVNGKLSLGFMHRKEEVFEYPAWYLEKLDKQSSETMRSHRQGKIKGYSDGEAFDALMQESEQYE